MLNIFDEIATLRAKSFNTEASLNFYKNIGIHQLYTEYTNDKKYSPSEIDVLEIGLKNILQNEKIFELFFITERNNELILSMLSSNDENVLAILADTILKNKEFLYNYLIRLINEDKHQEFSDMLDCIFFLLEEAAVEDGTTIIKMFGAIMYQKDSSRLLTHDLFILKLYNTLDSSNSVSRCRGFDLVIALCRDKAVSEVYYQRKLIHKCIGMYKSNDDLLEKLNLVELLKQFSGNKHALETIKELHLLDQFKIEIFASSTDMYLKRDLSVIVLDIFNNFIIEPDYQLIKAIYTLAKEFLSGYNEYINAGLEIILHLFISIETVDIITADKEFFIILKKIQRSNDSLRLKVFEFISAILTMRRVSLKTKSYMSLTDDIYSHLFVLIFTNDYTSKSQLSDNHILEGLEVLVKQLYTPFDDIEYTHLKIFHDLINYDRPFMKIFELPHADKLILYINSSSSKNEQINVLKKDLKSKFQEKIQSMSNRDPEFKKMVDKFVADLKNEDLDKIPEINTTFGI